MSVEQDWGRIVRWLERNAPRTAAKVRPAASPETRATVAKSFRPKSWPDDLRTWFALQDGEEWGEPWDGLLTSYVTLSLEGVLDEASVWAAVSTMDAARTEVPRHGLPSHRDSRTDSTRPAGDVADSFLPEFVPIGSDGSGNTLFVDLRDGPQRGCVTEYTKYGGPGEPLWASVSAMLADLADCLEGGTACNGYLPEAQRGELAWKFMDTADPSHELDEYPP